MTELVFKDPPRPNIAGGPQAHKHKEIAAKLRRRPGKWADLGTYGATGSARSVAYSIRNGGMAAYAPKGAFEAISRKQDDGTHVYARFVGGVGNG